MKTQKGFSSVVIVAIVLIIGVLTGAGWLVWHKNHQQTPVQTSVDTKAQATATKPATSQPNTSATYSYTVPDGYTTFTSSDGYSFSYPQAYGELTKQPPQNDVFILTSKEPVKSQGPGITGTISVYTRQPYNAVITARKYGPQIQLQNNKWIVVEPSDLDVTNNKKGDVYKDFTGNPIAAQHNGNITVYTLISGDEGVENDSLVFSLKGTLQQIQLPAFSDGTYGYNETANDKAAFNDMLTKVRDSVRITNQ